MWILCAGTFVNRFGTFVAVFLVLYLRDRGYSIAESGLVVSFYGGKQYYYDSAYHLAEDCKKLDIEYDFEEVKLGPDAKILETVRSSGYRLRSDWRARLS